MANIPKSILSKLEERKHNNAFRKLPCQNDLVDFASNDYLGFSRSKDIFEGAPAFLQEEGMMKNGATGSRLLSGNPDLYALVESQVARFHEAETALIFNSGYTANLGLLASVPQRGDIVFYDEYCHASIRDGIQLSNAKAYKFRHNDLPHLEERIQRLKEKAAAIYIVTESVFSMDGDEPDLEKLVAITEKYTAFLIVDEAHATGVVGAKGQGLVQQLSLEEKIFARVHTFGKGLGCHGAVVLGSKKLRDYLINFSRPFIYTTGLPPHLLATIMLAYRALEKTDAVAKLKDNIDFFKTKIKEIEGRTSFIESRSAIQCCVVPGKKEVKALAVRFVENGIDVKAILSPTVPEGKERLRFCLHSYNSFEEIGRAVELLNEKSV